MVLGWLKSLFGVPEPAGPPVAIREFSTSDRPIAEDGVVVEGDGWKLRAGGQETFRFFEVPDPSVEKCIVAYRAEMKTEDAGGLVYLEMWCRLPGGGEFFSKGLNQPLKGTTGWTSCEIPFYLKQGQRPDLIKLNVFVGGAGTVWVRNVKLFQTPLK